MAREVKNVLVNRIMDAALEHAAPWASGRLLDIGCGTKPYREIFAPFVSEHVGVDHEESPHGLTEADLVGSAYSIPVPDAAFDTVLCTAVLEHLEEPAEALKEARRVLRAGGVAIYTAPFIWHLHEEPRDFYRYSKHGLRYLFERAGFEIVELKPLAGFWVTFGQLLVYYLYRFDNGRAVRRGPLTGIGLGIQGLAWALDRLDRAEDWTWMYLVVARARNQGAVGHENDASAATS
jgi:ubiquinone/menaquinone biosynthesis C-methylase UbiE